MLAGLQLTCACYIMSQALMLSNKARQNSTVGEIVNLMSVDAQRLNDVVLYLHSIWSAPFTILLALIFLWFSMGASIFAGFAIMVLLIPVNIVVAAKNRKYQVRLEMIVTVTLFENQPWLQVESGETGCAA